MTVNAITDTEKGEQGLRLLILVLMHFNTATANSTNFASKLFYYVFFNL